jgi:hypothetical protein
MIEGARRFCSMIPSVSPEAAAPLADNKRNSAAVSAFLTWSPLHPFILDMRYCPHMAFE